MSNHIKLLHHQSSQFLAEFPRLSNGKILESPKLSTNCAFHYSSHSVSISLKQKESANFRLHKPILVKRISKGPRVRKSIRAKNPNASRRFRSTDELSSSTINVLLFRSWVSLCKNGKILESPQKSCSHCVSKFRRRSTFLCKMSISLKLSKVQAFRLDSCSHKPIQVRFNWKSWV